MNTQTLLVFRGLSGEKQAVQRGPTQRRGKECSALALLSSLMLQRAVWDA